MALTQKEISHNCYKRRKDNGLCPRCGKPLDRIGHYCTNCLKKSNEYSREVREWCKQNGICPECKKNKLFGDEHICPECLARKAMYRTNNPTSDEKRKENNERLKNSRKRCINSGKSKAFVPGVVNARR